MLEVIRRFEELEQLQGAWEQLCSESDAATLFQLPQWLLPWWRHLGGGDLLALVLREKGQLIGIAPLFLHGMPGKSIRQISFIGTGITDYLDFVVAPGFAGRFSQEVRDYLRQTKMDWDILNLEELRPGANALQLAEVQSEVISSCLVVDLPETVAEYRIKLDPVHRRNVRHALNQIEKSGAVRHEIAGVEKFQEFVHLHTASWLDRGETGVLQTAALQAFYMESASLLAKAGFLRLHLLYVDERPVASILAYHYRGRGYAYLGGFDPTWKKQSPGTALMSLAIERAIQEGLRAWDLLRGEEPYKYLWGAALCENRKIRL